MLLTYVTGAKRSRAEAMALQQLEQAEEGEGGGDKDKGGTDKAATAGAGGDKEKGESDGEVRGLGLLWEVVRWRGERG